MKEAKVTLYRLLTTGYLSVEAYHAFSSKKNLQDISDHDLKSVSTKIAKQIKVLRWQVQKNEALSVLESVTNNSYDYDRIIGLLEEILESAADEIRDIANKVGLRCFLMEYILCSRKLLGIKYCVTDDNYRSIIDISNTVIKTFLLNKSRRVSLEIEDTPNFENDKNEEDNCSSSAEVAYCVIDDDAVDALEPGNMVYARYLSTVSDNDFEPIFSYFEKVLSSVPVRTYNCVRSIGFRGFLVNYLYANEEKLSKIRNFGPKSMSDFLIIRDQLRSHIAYLCNNGHSEELLKIAANKEVKQAGDSRTLKGILGARYLLVENKFNELLSDKDLTVRARNGISAYPGDFIEDYVHSSNDVKTLKNIGKKTELEITKLIYQLKVFIADIPSYEMIEEETQLVVLKAKYGRLIDDYSKDFYLREGRLPLFHLVENVLLEKTHNRNFQFLNLYMPFFKEYESLPMDVIADNNNLTRERVRQICSKASDMICEGDSTSLHELYLLMSEEQSVCSYIEKLQEKDIIDINDIYEVIRHEDSNLSDDILLLMFSKILADNYVVVGNAPYHLPTKTRTWCNTFFVKKEYAQAFDFNKMYDAINDYSEERTEDAYLSNKEVLLDVLYNVWIEFDGLLVEELSQIVSVIMIEEFGIYKNIDDKFEIKGKKTTSPAEFVYETLKMRSDSIFIEDMFKLLSNEFPNRYKSAASVKYVVMSDPRLCIVTNKIGLTEWSHIKVGTVRDIIVQYLAKFDEPKPLSDIIDYVQRHRDSSDNSIRTTMGSGTQFVHFSGGLYGLADKTYDCQFKKNNDSRRSFEQRIVELEKFLNSQGHFPFSVSDNAEELALQRWWKRINKSSDATEYQKSEIQRIEDTYKEYPDNKRDFVWERSCMEYTKFYMENGRKPDAYDKGSKRLVSWFESAKQNFIDGYLNTHQETAFIELCKKF